MALRRLGRIASAALIALSAWATLLPGGRAAAAAVTPGRAALAVVAALGLPMPANGPVTRADAVIAVDAVAGLAAANPSQATYTDVSPSDAYYGAIEAASAAGLLSGWAPAAGRFRPGAPMTRIDLAILAVNVLGLAPQARSLARDSAAYPALRTIHPMAAAYLGDAVLMLRDGIVPPEGPRVYAPYGPVSLPSLALALDRMWRLWDVPMYLRLLPTTPSVAPGEADSLAVSATNRLGSVVPEANLLAHYPVTYTVAAPGSVANGVFSAPAVGSYLLTAALSGPLLTAPVAGTTTVAVVSQAAPVTYAITTAEGDSYPAGNAVGITFSVTANGVPAAGVAVTLTAVAAAGDLAPFDLSLTDGGSPVPSLVAATNQSGQVTVFLTDTTFGDEGSVTASIGTTTAATGTIAIEAVDPDLTLATTAAPSVAAAPSNVVLTLAALDPYGNPVTGLSATDFSVQSDDAAAGTGGVLPLTGVTYDSADEEYTLTATDTNEVLVQGVAQPQTLTISVDGTTVATASLTVTAGTPQTLSLAAPASVTAGTPFTATLTVADAYGNPVSGVLLEAGSGSGALTMSGLADSPSGAAPTLPTGPVVTANGSASLDLTAVDAGTATLTAEIAGISNLATAVVTVLPGAPETGDVLSGAWQDSAQPPVTGSLTPTAQTFVSSAAATQAVSGESDAGTPPDVNTLTFRAEDAYGNPITSWTGSATTPTVSLTPGEDGDGKATGTILDAVSPVAENGTFTVALTVADSAMSTTDGGVPDALRVGATGALVTTVAVFAQ